MLKLKAIAFMLLALTIGLCVVVALPILLLVGWALILGVSIVLGFWFIYRVIQEEESQQEE